MKYNLALYCKTYKNDIHRLAKLIGSLEDHNKDNIPVFISCPRSDMGFLEKELLDFEATLIADEDIFKPTVELAGWENQMLVKLNAFNRIPAENMLILDSDVFFIDDFYESDFIAYDDVPYTIIHENIQVAEYETFLKNGDYKKTGYAKAVKAYRDLFGGKSNRIYDYGPNPHLWNRKVLEHFKENYLQKYGMTMEQFCLAMKQQYDIHFRETLTYGEYLLATKVIDIVPCGPLFKCYHWKEMYDFELKNGMVEMDKIKQNYLGVVLQSNWL
jgi:hypothetical protein